MYVFPQSFNFNSFLLVKSCNQLVHSKLYWILREEINKIKYEISNYRIKSIENKQKVKSCKKCTILIELTN